MAASLQFNRVRRTTISTRLVDSGALLFDPDRRIELFLNATGSLVWQLLDGRHSRLQIIEQLKSNFAAADHADQDFDNYLELLTHNQLLENSSTVLPEETFFGHSDSPLSYDISLTGQCNLSCPFCFYADAIRTRTDLPADEWQQFFGELKTLGARNICLSGGEILCRTDLFTLIDSAVASRLRYSLISNGTLGDRQFVARLCESPRRNRLDSIQLSVDGSGPQTHDIIRGDGSFARTDAFLRLLHEAGLPVTVRVTVSRVNLDDLQKTFAYLLDDIGLRSVSTNSACSLGSAADNSGQLDLSPGERRQAMQTLRHLADNIWPGRITAQAGPLYESRQFEAMQQHQPLNSAYNGRLSACGCFKSKLAVHHDGTIIPCNMLGNIELGRINRDRIIDIWLHHPALKKLAARTTLAMKNLAGCHNCEYAAICNGGCPAEEIAASGDFFKPAASNCYRLFLQQLDRETNKS